MTQLPVLLSIPHGGTKRPPELDGHLCITEHDMFDDSDPFVVEIYNLGDEVRHVVKTDIARAFVDLNRSPQDLPPNNPDGLIKSMTCYQKPIYVSGLEPDDSLTGILIDAYYRPYHGEIQKSVTEMDLLLCLDCHTMAEVAPAISPDGNRKKRPLFCLSNRDGKTSSRHMIELLADCISDSFFIDRNDILLNDPFHGGYITKTYGNNPIPWIQVEMNRNMYLSEEWFDRSTLIINRKRLRDINNMFKNAVNLFFKRLD